MRAALVAVPLGFVFLLGFAMSSEAQIQMDTTNGWYPTKITSGVTKFYTRLVTSPSADVYAGKSSQLFGMAMNVGDTVIVMKKLGREYSMPCSIKVANKVRTIVPVPGDSVRFITDLFVFHLDTAQQFWGYDNRTAKTPWLNNFSLEPSPPVAHIKKADAIGIKFYVIGKKIDLAEILFDNFEFIYEDGSKTIVDDFEGTSVGTGIVGTSNTFPNGYTLTQNYPNPFNPRTTIEFTIPKAGLVKLTVYNILCQEVAMLVNQTFPAGAHQALFEPSLPSGIYFYRIQAGDFIQTRKMMLIK